MSIIVGYVHTKEGRSALRFAVREARLRAEGAIVVVPATWDEAGDGSTPDADLAAARSELDSAGLSVEVRRGTPGNDPAEDLIEASSSAEDVIVIGLRRRTPIGKLILGSNAQRILLDAPCPVIAVKAED